MRLWKRDGPASELAALNQSLESLREYVKNAEMRLTHAITHEIAELESRVSRETLSWNELYDKTYHLQKRIEQRQRSQGVPEEEPNTAGVDQITERVRARRNRKGA